MICPPDESTVCCVTDLGRNDRQIWGKRADNEPIVEASLFVARCTDRANIEVATNAEFGTPAEAETVARSFTPPPGLLPAVLRAGGPSFSADRGQEGFYGGTGQVIVYSGTGDERASYNPFEESLLHEAAHATLDQNQRLADGWRRAQASDRRFLTSYAAQSPGREDLAEDVLFAFAIFHHPDRFPLAGTEAIMRAVPNRIAYVKTLLPLDKPLIYSVGDEQSRR